MTGPPHLGRRTFTQTRNPRATTASSSNRPHQMRPRTVPNELKIPKIPAGELKFRVLDHIGRVLLIQALIRLELRDNCVSVQVCGTIVNCLTRSFCERFHEHLSTVDAVSAPPTSLSYLLLQIVMCHLSLPLRLLAALHLSMAGCMLFIIF